MGGGVYIYRGSFMMHGGEIVDNTASSISRVNVGSDANSDGGGVYIDRGSFTMYGGKIIGNTATSTTNNGNNSGISSSEGGGVYNVAGSFTMYDGEIISNTATAMSSGSSHNNNAVSRGGGVFGTFGDNFTMLGGLITDNTASTTALGPHDGPRGGGVNSNLVKTGGTITGYSSDTVAGNKLIKNGIISSDGPFSSGYSVYHSSSRYRDTTAGPTDNINTATGQGLSADGQPPFRE